MHHEFENEKVTSRLEESGYGSLQPAILPEKLEDICKEDPTLKQSLESMFTYVTRYAHDIYSMMLEQRELSDKRERGENTLEDAQELARTDERRHNLHEALIDSVNLLSRELAKRDKDNSWMNEVVSNGRAGYARFALLTFYRIHVKVK